MKKLVLVIVIALLTLTGSGYAGSIAIDFVGFQAAGWQVGSPYYATVNAGSVTDVMCDDWVHGGLAGDTWQANFTNLGTGDISLLRYNQVPGALVLYDEAGWLLMQTEIVPRTQWEDINYAVWHIFVPTAPLPGPGSLYWLKLAEEQAAIGFPGVDFSDVGIYTPINQYDPNSRSPQELLISPAAIVGAVSTPEPGTLLLLGSGFAGLLARKRMS